MRYLVDRRWLSSGKLMIAVMLLAIFGESLATRRRTDSAGILAPHGRIRAEFRPFFRTDGANARITA
ncbi:hypothetical protein ACIBG0_31590 [Nocardia sp. NPDC050630]|uniref:hypothetical protein n=1 Tax=Nocardia sp. NPDC050630 TaxID=3364321 RepID=UPI0037AD45EE